MPMSTREIAVSDKDGARVKANLLACSACTNESFLAYVIEGQDHPHLQCCRCGASYCVRTSSCAGPDPEPEAAGDSASSDWPRSLKAALRYLQDNPRVLLQSTSEREELNGERHYLRFQNGLLWLRHPDGSERHLPIGCGAHGQESGLSFKADGFLFTKFGITTAVFYMEGPNGGGRI